MGTFETKEKPLHAVKPGTKVKVLSDIKTPPDAPEIKVNDIIEFIKLDGMYSLCKNSEGENCHLAAWTKVEEVVE